MEETHQLPVNDITVVYIMGYGRSGSTFLDILLHNHPEIVSVGALSNFFDWAIKDATCACDSEFSQCEFWGKICDNFCANGQNQDSLRKEQLMVESRANFIKLLRDELPASLTSKYGTVMRDLFESIAKSSGKSFIVDSSKSAREVVGRAYALARYTSLDVKLIHLVRDVRGVIWSVMKGPGSPERSQPNSILLRALKSTVGWILANIACLYITRRLGDHAVLVMRYENLVSNPEKEITRIGNFLEIDVKELVQRIESKASFTVGHNLGGNRLRFSDQITIKPDYEWQYRLPLIYKIGSWLLAWPLEKRFEYRLTL